MEKSSIPENSPDDQWPVVVIMENRLFYPQNFLDLFTENLNPLKVTAFYQPRKTILYVELV